MRYAALGALAGLLVAPVGAVPTGLASGVYDLAGTTAAAQPELAGTAIKDDVLPYSIHANVKGQPGPTVVGHGTVQVRVVRTRNGTLTFYWKVNNAADSKNSLAEIDVGIMPVRAYDVNWRVDGLGTAAPDKVRLAVLPNSVGSYTFLFDKQPIEPGQSSRFFFIRTSAIKMGKTSIAPLMKAQSDFTDAVLGAAPEF